MHTTAPLQRRSSSRSQARDLSNHGQSDAQLRRLAQRQCTLYCCRAWITLYAKPAQTDLWSSYYLGFHSIHCYTPSFDIFG
jgi:hypothetical protein